MVEVVVGMGVKESVCLVVICVPVLLFLVGTVMVIFPCSVPIFVVRFLHWCFVVVFTLLVMALFPRWCFVTHLVSSLLMLNWSMSPVTLRILALLMVYDVLMVIVVGGLILVVMVCRVDVVMVHVFRLMFKVQNLGFTMLRVAFVDLMLLNVSMARVVGLKLVIVLLMVNIVMVSHYLSLRVKVIIVVMVDDLSFLVVNQALVLFIMMTRLIAMARVDGLKLVLMLHMVNIVMVSDQLSTRVDVIIVVMVDDLGLVMVG
jgi:hypothetical protein